MGDKKVACQPATENWQPIRPQLCHYNSSSTSILRPHQDQNITLKQIALDTNTLKRLEERELCSKERGSQHFPIFA